MITRIGFVNGIKLLMLLPTRKKKEISISGKVTVVTLIKTLKVYLNINKILIT